jgi:polyphosphate kinase 2 (PPK2 family)
VRPGEKVKLRDRPTIVKPFCKSKKAYQELLGEHVEGSSSLQQLLYPSNRYALLLIFQGMDAAGKDGAIQHVTSGVNPQGCEVFSFKQPSADELEHDFLWRTTCRLPERGRIGIFNRSYCRAANRMRSMPGPSSNRSLTVAALLEHCNQQSRDRKGAVSNTPGLRPHTTSRTAAYQVSGATYTDFPLQP